MKGVVISGKIPPSSALQLSLQFAVEQGLLQGQLVPGNI